ncbi:ABC transporter substrate-binding protein [Eoetvoesiella caeni]
MLKKQLIIIAASAALLAPTFASAQDNVKIGFSTVLSSPMGYIGEEQRNGFQLAIEQEQGKLGGYPVELLIADDAAKPDIGKQNIDRMLQQDGARIISGVALSHIIAATMPDVVAADRFFIGPNGGPDELAGPQCKANYFIVSHQASSQSEVAGELANQLGAKRTVLIAPNYNAGTQSFTAFKHLYKGEIAGEILTKMNQTDYAAEIAQIRAMRPDSVYFFLPGGMGVNFVKQIKRSGLANIKLIAPMTLDDRMIEALGDLAEGISTTTFWNWDLDNEYSQNFVASYRAKYGKIPTTYAAAGYDTAHLIGSALKATGGDSSKVDEFRAALKKADFKSVRGSFKFANNHHPIQDWYQRTAYKDNEGKLYFKTEKLIVKGYTDSFAASCPL